VGSGSQSPEALLARPGLGIAAPAFWRSGLALLEGVVDRARELAI
jgi:oligoendopeptidase F